MERLSVCSMLVLCMLLKCVPSSPLSSFSKPHHLAAPPLVDCASLLARRCWFASPKTAVISRYILCGRNACDIWGQPCRVMAVEEKGLTLARSAPPRPAPTPGPRVAPCLRCCYCTTLARKLISSCHVYHRRKCLTKEEVVACHTHLCLRLAELVGITPRDKV